jgi:hypothetical protein
LGVLLWPRRTLIRRRLLAFTAVGFLVLLSWTLPWNPWGARFILTAMALGAPLVGLVVQRRGRALQVLALVLAVWGGASGLYAAWLNENKPVPEIAKRDRLDHLIASGDSNRQGFYREVDQELPPAGTVAVSSGFDEWDYPFFGARFGRTLVPLVEANYADRFGLIRPLRWANESLWSQYDPGYLVTFQQTDDEQKHPELAGRCFPLTLQNGRPAVRWELWRCDDRDPRNLLQNGDFSAWSRAGLTELPDGWSALTATGAELRLTRQSAPAAEGREPFRARLTARGASGAGAGILQVLEVDDVLRGSTVVVDVRLQASRGGAALLILDDGFTVTEFANLGTAPETIRLWHQVDPEATQLEVVLLANPEGQVADIQLRSILAIPRPAP